MRCSVFFLIVWCGVVNSEFYDSFSGNEINRTRYEALSRLGLVPYCAIQVAACDARAPRRIDGSCNNPRYPARGTTLTPYRRLLPPAFSEGGDLRTSVSGKPLPRVRPLRVALMSDGRVASERYTHMVANYNVFATGEVTSVHDTVNYVVFTTTCCTPAGRQDPRCIPIEVQDDDPHLRRSNVRCMNLTRSITYQRLGCVPDSIPPERINTAPPMLDLSAVYGHDERSAQRGRSFRGGELRGDMLNGKLWPPSGSPVCINNVAPRETRCHDVPVAGANAILGLNLLFLWLYRSHNDISRQLRILNPCWDDDKLYFTAKEVNVAYFVHIMYYEMMTELLGRDFLLKNKVVFDTQGHVNDYDPTLEPRVSIDYVAATRWFHTIQEGRLKMYTKEGLLYDEVEVVDFILRTGALPLNNTIEGMTQGSFRQPGAAADSVVDPDIGERILGRLQFASDVLASDIVKGRDVGLPPYNEYRRMCGLPAANKFRDLLQWMGRTQVEAMATFYEHPADIDLLAGLLAERAMPGAFAGPTLSCIMAEQLLYWRRADRFWYEHEGHPGAFTKEQLLEIRKMTLAKMMCQHGDGVDAVQPYAFLIPGPRNEITKCSKYEMPNLNVFRDERCYPKPTPSQEKYSEQYAFLTTPGYQKPPNIDRNQEYIENTLQSGYNLNPSSFNNMEYPNVNIITTNQRYPNPNLNPGTNERRAKPGNPIIIQRYPNPNLNPETNERRAKPGNPIIISNQKISKSDSSMPTNRENTKLKSKISTNAKTNIPKKMPKVKIIPNGEPTISTKEKPVINQALPKNPSSPNFEEYSGSTIEAFIRWIVGKLLSS